MADAKQTAPKTEPVTKPAPRLARASEATDPAVHQLLAERQAHEMNKATAEATDPEAAKAADEKIAEVNRKLADLGYE